MNGLDPAGIVWLRGLLRSLADEGRTVLVSSHLMNEMALAADHVLIIGRGRLVADSSVGEFVSRAGGRVLRVRTTEPDLLAACLAGIATIRPSADHALIVESCDAATLASKAALAGIGAKTALIACLGLTGGTAIALASFLLGQAAFAPSSMRESLGSPGALRVVLGGGMVLTLVSLLGPGLGLLLRKAVAGTAALVVLLYLLPPFTSALSTATRRAIVRYMPDQLAAPVLAAHQTSGVVPSLGPWAALTVFTVEIGILLMAGSAVLIRLDV
jgi:hypothetical protein